MMKTTYATTRALLVLGLLGFGTFTLGACPTDKSEEVTVEPVDPAQLEKKFAEEAKTEITKDNADAAADALLKEIEGDTE
ncbi:MAG: hypothetical protein ACYTFT_03655 [Planctomycetota bacterium]|jgi:hypothetical protein